MPRSEKIAKKINKKIREWEKGQSKLIVAIDGYAGSGKTTIANFIVEQNPDVLVIQLDDFINHWKDRQRMIKASNNKPSVFQQNWYRYKDLEKLLKVFKTKDKGFAKFKIYDYNKNDFGASKSFDLSKKVLVIEGIFLFHPAHKISRMWGKTIYLKADLTKADKQRVSREKKRWGKDYIPENHPDNWIRYYKKAYRQYIREQKPQKNRDLVLKV